MTLVLSTLWLCFAPISEIKSQESTKKINKDTMFIIPDPTLKILLIGNDLRDMVDYTRGDSLVELFLKDFNSAVSKEAISGNSKTTHYIVHPNGKRRFKAENEDYQEPVINIKQEIKSIGLDLPPHLYIIYDVRSDMEIQLYMQNSEQLKDLNKINLTELLKQQKADKKALRKSYCIELKSENNEWKKSTRRFYGREALEINPLFGAGIIGSQLSPQASFQFSYGQTTKYGQGLWRAGISYQVNLLSSYTNNDFSDVKVVQSVNVNFLLNYSDLFSYPYHWFGVEFGYVTSAPGILNHSLKFGVLYSFRSVQLGFHCYFLDKSIVPGNPNTKSLYGVSFTF